MKAISKKKNSTKRISALEFDQRFEKGKNLIPFLDFKNATIVRRVNVDFPSWMIERLDLEAAKLNVSRQAIIKMWIHDRLSHPSRPKQH